MFKSLVCETTNEVARFPRPRLFFVTWRAGVCGIDQAVTLGGCSEISWRERIVFVGNLWYMMKDFQETSIDTFSLKLYHVLLIVAAIINLRLVMWRCSLFQSDYPVTLLELRTMLGMNSSEDDKCWLCRACLVWFPLWQMTNSIIIVFTSGKMYL